MEFNGIFRRSETKLVQNQTNLWERALVAAAVNPTAAEAAKDERRLGKLEGHNTLHSALSFEQMFYVTPQDHKHNCRFHLFHHLLL